MVKRIIYPHETGIAVLYCHDANGQPLSDIPIEEIARKDVPAGVPFLFVDETEIPYEPEEWDGWSEYFSTPDGYGIGQEAWFAEQAAANGD